MSNPRIDVPVEGFYRTQLVRRGLNVGVRFYFDADGYMRVEVDGRTHKVLKQDDGSVVEVLLDPLEVWPWCCGAPIPEREFNFLARRREWAKEHAPDHPAANPREPIDLNKLPPPACAWQAIGRGPPVRRPIGRFHCWETCTSTGWSITTTSG